MYWKFIPILTRRQINILWKWGSWLVSREPCQIGSCFINSDSARGRLDETKTMASDPSVIEKTISSVLRIEYNFDKTWFLKVYKKCLLEKIFFKLFINNARRSSSRISELSLRFSFFYFKDGRTSDVIVFPLCVLGSLVCHSHLNVRLCLTFFFPNVWLDSVKLSSVTMFINVIYFHPRLLILT